MQRDTTYYNNATIRQGSANANTGLVGWFFWAVLFVLYFPAARAGFVTDFTGWLDQVKNHGFWEYINRTNFHAKSLYQFTQFNTYIYYKLFGINAWMWHLLFISLHAVNAYMLFKLAGRLLEDAGVPNARAISFSGALLFCITPYASEVIVWEPSFHFLQGLLLILIILSLIRSYIYDPKAKYLRWALILYFLSTFSLEIFYITPWLVLTVAIFYGVLPTVEKGTFRKVALRFFLPMLVLFCIRLVLFRVVYGEWVSRIGTSAVSSIGIADFGKPAKYLFHLLFLGRFFSHNIREVVYGFCDSTKGIAIFYGIISIAFVYIIACFRKLGGKGKVASLFFTWTMIALALLIPLWFQDLLLVLFDRYTYFTAAFLYILLTVAISFIPSRCIRLAVVILLIVVNLRYTVQVSRFWCKAYKVDYGLLHNIPLAGDKTIILLNLPESMKGVAMIGSDKESEYKFMHNLLLPAYKIDNKVYDVLSYNMTTPTDGAHAKVINDSTVQVVLNQWGTWWWFAGKGGYNYENEDYRLDIRDPGYYLTLKKPAQGYLILYSVGREWKVVDWGKKNVDQY